MSSSVMLVLSKEVEDGLSGPEGSGGNHESGKGYSNESSIYGC
jgi:hypothetical protein